MKKRCIIVGSAPSAKGFIPPDGIDIIAINGSIEWLSRADIFFTLDHSEANLERLRNPRDGTRYYVAFPDSVETPSHVKRLQRFAQRGREPIPKDTPQWFIWRWSAVLGLSEVPGVIHSGNSAYGSCGLAYQLGYQHVALIGVDATQDERMEGGKPNDLSHLPLLFQSALNQLDIVSCGLLTGIPRMTIAEWIKATDDCHSLSTA